MEGDPVLLMKRLPKTTQVRTQNSLHRTFFGCHDVDLNFPRAQGCGNFEPDEACAQHDCPACRLCPFDDRSAVGKRAKHEQIRWLCAGNGRVHGLGPRRQKKSVEGNSVSVGERHFMHADIDPGYGCIETKVDGVLGIETTVAQGHPLFWCAASEIVL